MNLSQSGEEDCHFFRTCHLGSIYLFLSLSLYYIYSQIYEDLNTIISNENDSFFSL